LITGLALLLSGLLGGLLARTHQGAMDRLKFRWMLTFCGGLLFSTAILHLLPEVLAYGHPTENLWLLSGFFLQFILEKFSAGIEHGHLHHEANHNCDHPLHEDLHLPLQGETRHGETSHEGVLHIGAMHDGSPYAGPQIPLQATSSRLTKDKNPLQSSNLTRASSWGLMISLSIHGLIEGIPVSAASDHIDSPLAWSPLLLGILLHKAPTTFALAALLLRQKATPLLLWSAVLWVSCCTPLGLWIGHGLGHTSDGNREILHALMALATGSFLQIASTILFESSNNHKFNWFQLSGALLGAYLAYFMGH
ncbi:MAG: ZIP family metal transporter, partial [Bacteroidota bacterium]